MRGILRNPVYAGHLVMGKRVRPSFKSHKSFSVLPENYKVVRDVHQPIVDLEDFELVQRMITSRRYEEEQASLEQAISEMEKQREESGREKSNIEQFTRMIKDYAGIEELSAALLNMLIEKVTVGEPKEVDRERIQEVKIYNKFIGNIS